MTGKPREFPLLTANIPHEKFCNANQTCLCCQKLPDTLHVDAKNKKDHKEAKQMKDKTGVTPTVCASADGGKASLAMIGSAKKPVCFELLVEGDHCDCILLMDDAKVHILDKNDLESLPKWLHILFFPPNLTSHAHPTS